MEGHKVKAYIMFKGRMITHPEIGRKLMEEIVEKLNDISKIESPPKMEGKQLFAYFLPDKNKITIHKESLKKHKTVPEAEKGLEVKSEKPKIKPEENQLKGLENA